jgi:hypothetical protein
MLTNKEVTLSEVEVATEQNLLEIMKNCHGNCNLASHFEFQKQPSKQEPPYQIFSNSKK